MGIMQMLFGALSAGTIYSIVTAAFSAFYGYSSGIAGSVTPTPIVLPLAQTHNVTIVECPSAAPSFDFFVEANFNVGQLGGFNQIQVEDSTGTVRTYTAASAAYNAGNNSWTWGSGSNPVWTSSGQTRSFAIS